MSGNNKMFNEVQRRILFVSNDESICERWLKALDSEAFEQCRIVVSDNIDDATDLFEKSVFDCIIILHTPRTLDARSFMRRQQSVERDESKFNHHTPTLVYYRKNDDSAAFDCLELGAFDVRDIEGFSGRLFKNGIENALRLCYLNELSETLRTPMNGIITTSQLLLNSQLNHEQHDLSSIIHISAQKLLEAINNLSENSFEKVKPTDTNVEACIVPNTGSESESQIGQRVLIVEDDHINQLVTKRLCAQLELKSDVVASGPEALDCITKKDYLLVLMDNQLPVMDGLETTAGIRKLPPPFNSIPIIGLSANASEKLLKKAKKVRMNHVLVKPFTIQQFTAALRPFLPEEMHVRIDQANENFRFLIVEDEMLILQLYHRQLKNAFPGSEIRLAENGRKALKLLDGFTPDIVITDYLMPEMDGGSLIDNMLKNKDLEHTEYIVITSLDPKNLYIGKLQKKGIKKIIKKPFQPKELPEMVRGILALRFEKTG